MTIKSVRYWGGPLIVAGLLFASGCGSGGYETSGNSSGTQNPSGVLPSGATSFVGRAYASQIALSGGLIGNLNFVTAANNAAVGSLQVVDPTRAAANPAQAAKTRLVLVTTPVSGTFNPQTGAINLTGSYTLNGQIVPVAITGTLPTPPAVTGGSVTVTTSGQASTSTFGGPTPSPSPSPLASPTAAPTPAPSPSLTPTPSPTTAPTPAPAPIVVIVVPGIVSLNVGDTALFSATVTGTTNRAVVWQVEEAGGGTIDSSGSYHAPSTRGTYHVVAVSAADGTAQSRATVTVQSGGIGGTIQ